MLNQPDEAIRAYGDVLARIADNLPRCARSIGCTSAVSTGRTWATT
jgi:hypothetical protein